MTALVTIIRFVGRSGSIVGGALLFATVFFMPMGASAQQSVTLRLDWTTLGYHAPFYYGVAKGIYRNAGLDVDIAEGKGSASVTQLVAAGRSDFGFADATTAALLVGRGLPVKVIMGVLRGTTITIFYAKDRGISSPASLSGHRISVCPGDALTRYIPAYLRSLDIDPSSVEKLSVACSLKYTVVAQHRADAVMSYAMAGKPLLAKVGVSHPGKLSPGKAFYLPGHGIVASDQMINEHPDLIRRFVAATTQSWLAAMNDPDGAVAAVIAAKPLLKDQATALKESLLTAMEYTNSPSTKDKPFGYQSLKDWQKAIKILQEYAGLGKGVKAQNVFSNDFVSKSVNK